MKNTAFFGPFPVSLKRALKQVIDLLLSEGKSFWLYYESRSAIERVAALSAMLAKLDRISTSSKLKKSLSIVLVVFQGDIQQKPRTACAHRIDRISIPFNIETLLKTKPTTVDKLREIIKQDTLHASAQFKSEHAKHELHESAIKPLWQRTLPFIQEGALLCYSALLVDDRVEDPGTDGYAFCCEAAGILHDWGWDVKLTPTLQHAKEKKIWRLDKEKPTPALKREDEYIPLEHFEVVFLDIARPVKKSRNVVISIEGIRLDLLTLSRARSVLRFPQIYMLSHIMASQIAHLCYELGADYYFEKSEFLNLSKTDFEKILGHTIWLARGNSDMALRGDSEAVQYDSVNLKKDNYGWTVENLFPGNPVIDLEEKNSFELEVARKQALVKHFFSRAYDITAVQLIKRHGGGYSGAMTLEVIPVKSRKTKDQGDAYLFEKQKPRVIKIANLYELGRELSAHEISIKPYVSSEFARVEPQWAVNHGYGVIAYERAGGTPDSYLVMLEDCMSKPAGLKPNVPYEWAMRLLSRICHALPPLHLGGRSKPAFKPIRDAWVFARKELLGSELKKAPNGNGNPHEMNILVTKGVSESGMGPQNLVIGFDKVEKPVDLRTWFISEPNISMLGPDEMIRPGKRFEVAPEISSKVLFQTATAAIDAELNTGNSKAPHIERLKQARAYIYQLRIPERMTRWAEKSFSDTEEKVSWGTIHGDLRLGNIMMEPYTAAIWIIDYGKTREGPLPMDYIQMAFDIRMRCIAPYISEALGDDKEAGIWIEAAKGQIKAFENALPSVQPCIFDWKAQWIARLYEKAGSNYEVVEALFLLRVLQLYRAEPKTTDGLVAIIWGAWLLDKRLTDAGFPCAEEKN